MGLEVSLYPSFVIYWLLHDKGSFLSIHLRQIIPPCAMGARLNVVNHTTVLFFLVRHRFSVNISHDYLIPRLDFKVLGF